MADETEKPILTGRLKIIGKIDQATPTFKKLLFVVVTDEQYPQPIQFELHQDKVGLLAGFLPGDEVEVHFNLRGREWINPNGKALYFNTFICWRIKKLANGYIVPTQDGGQIQHNLKFPPAHEVFDTAPIGNPKEYNFSEEDHDDLPF